MSVTIAGTAETAFSSQANGNQAITVPSDAEAIIVTVAGYVDGSTGPLFTALEFNPAPTVIDLTSVVRSNWTAAGTNIDTYIITKTDPNWPGTGAQTLYFTAAGYIEGFVFGVFYVKGIDTATPIGAIDSRINGGDWTSALSACPVGDLGVVVVMDTGANPDCAPATYGQTSIYSTALINGDALGVGYEDGETALRAEGTEIVPTAFVIQAGNGEQTITDMDFISSNSQTFLPVVHAITQTVTVTSIIGGENLSGLDYVVFDGQDLETMTKLKSGSGETTDANGDLIIDLNDVSVNDGDPLLIIIGDWTATPISTNKAAVCYANAVVG